MFFGEVPLYSAIAVRELRGNRRSQGVLGS